MKPPQPEARPLSEAVRLAKRVAELVPCSRREAELYIEGGWVLVDGQVVEEPQFRVLQHKVELHPEASLLALPPVTLLLHKPAGCDAGQTLQLMTPATHAAGDRSGIRTVKKHFAKLVSTLPLPAQASGLVVLTQDWRVARKLSEEADTLEQELIVDVAGELAPGGLKLLCHGLSLDGRALPPIKVSWNSQSDSENRLRFALKGVRPGQIAPMCDSVGLQVLAIKRIRIGRVPMAGLPPGQWRYLQPHERF